MVKEIEVNLIAANVEGLDAELRAALGNRVAGLRVGRNVTVLLNDNAQDSDVLIARQVADAHDPKKLTTDQTAKLDRQTKLKQMRKDYAVSTVDVTAYGSQPVLIQQLAQKIAWLEQELLHLRGGNV